MLCWYLVRANRVLIYYLIHLFLDNSRYRLIIGGKAGKILLLHLILIIFNWIFQWIFWVSLHHPSSLTKKIRLMKKMKLFGQKSEAIHGGRLGYTRRHTDSISSNWVLWGWGRRTGPLSSIFLWWPFPVRYFPNHYLVPVSARVTYANLSPIFLN